MDLDKIFDSNYNAYSEIKHGKTTEQMPTMNKEKFIKVVTDLVKNHGDIGDVSVSCNNCIYQDRCFDKFCDDCNDFNLFESKE